MSVTGYTKAGSDAAYGRVVMHGATAGTARPSTSLSVQWVGTVTPTNAVNGDTYLNTTTGNEQVMVASAFQTLNKTANDASYAHSAFPSYVTTPPAGPFDPTTGAYNLRTTNTARLRAGLDRTFNGTAFTGSGLPGARCEIAIIGTSLEAISYDQTATVSHMLPWSRWLLEGLVKRGIPKGGTGLVRCTDGSVRVDAYWNNSGGAWVANNATHAYTTTAGQWMTFTPGVAGDTVTVYYYNTGSSGDVFTVSVAGASSGSGFTTVTGSGTPGWTKVTLNTPVLPAQLVKITLSSGIIYLAGACVSNSAGGVLVHNIAQTGSRARGAVNTGAWDQTGSTTEPGVVFANPQLSTTYPYPDAVFIALGANDLANSTGTNAQIYTSISNIAARYPNSDIILVADTPLNNTVVLDTAWQAFVSGLYGLADTLGVPLIDLRARFGTSADIWNNGYAGDGTGHLNAKGAAAVGRNMATAIGGLVSPPPAILPWRPDDNNLLAANFAPRHQVAVNTPPAGYYFANRVRIPAGVPITNVWLNVVIAGAGLTYGAVAVYEADGSRAGITASQTTNWATAGAQKMPLGSVVPAHAEDRWVWVTFACAGTTIPQFGVSSGYAIANMGLDSVEPKVAGYLTGATPLPTTLAMGSMGPYNEFWVGIS